MRKLIRNDFEKAFRDVDAIVCPTSPVVAFPIGEKIDDPLKLYAVDVLTVPANLATVPGIYGRPFEDATILRLAHGFQGATKHHLDAPPVRARSS